MTHLQMNVGPLEPLLSNAAITAIHIRTTIHYEKSGATHSSDLQFSSDNQRWQVINSIVRAGGMTLSADNPVVDCVLADGTQVHAEYEPLSMSLRKAGQW